MMFFRFQTDASEGSLLIHAYFPGVTKLLTGTELHGVNAVLSHTPPSSHVSEESSMEKIGMECGI